MALQSFDDGNSDEARQFLLDNRCERLHPKRHRTMKRAKKLASQKRSAAKTTVAVKDAAARRFKNRVAAYWAGDMECHP